MWKNLFSVRGEIAVDEKGTGMRKIRDSRRRRFGTVKFRKKQHCNTFELPILLKKKQKKKILRKRGDKTKRSLRVPVNSY
jgi:hypothetical protein